MAVSHFTRGCDSRNGCISLHPQLWLLGSKSIFSKFPCQTSCINPCFMLALLRVSLSIPSWTFDSYWERTLEKELRNVATTIKCLERRVTEYFMRLTSGTSCVHSSKIFPTQLLYTGCSKYHIVRRHYFPRLTPQLHYPESVRKKKKKT
jgi:hypothetical protein